MHITFFNPQGNFDPADSYWTEHPDFGGQLVYVKEVALALSALGNTVDIVTRQIKDPDWPEFSKTVDHYPIAGHPGAHNVRILRFPCGPDRFLPKEQLWQYLGTEWVPRIAAFYEREGRLPDAATTHYGDGGLSGALYASQTGVPYTFTGHSLGAQKMDKLGANPENLAEIDARYNFRTRILAERFAMKHAGKIITSTKQERFEQYAHPAYHDAVDPSDDRKFAVIPPGVNQAIFSQQLSPTWNVIRTRIQEALERDIEQERRHLPVVVSASRLDPKKNLIGLVRAFASNQKLRQQANLAIVVRGVADPLREYEKFKAGEAAVFREVSSFMDRSMLHGKVTAFPLNSQQELAEGYRVLAGLGSVFALAALYEPFGLAPLEAISCGLPAVVTRNGGPSESLYEDGRRFGILVDPEDPQDIANGILEAIKSPEFWKELQAAGLERVAQKYTWSRTAESYLAVLKELTKPQIHSGKIPLPTYFTQTNQPIALERLESLYFRKVE